MAFPPRRCWYNEHGPAINPPKTKNQKPKTFVANRPPPLHSLCAVLDTAYSISPLLDIAYSILPLSTVLESVRGASVEALPLGCLGVAALKPPRARIAGRLVIRRRERIHTDGVLAAMLPHVPECRKWTSEPAKNICIKKHLYKPTRRLEGDGVRNGNINEQDIENQH